jgi:hypothetical protein
MFCDTRCGWSPVAWCASGFRPTAFPENASASPVKPVLPALRRGAGSTVARGGGRRFVPSQAADIMSDKIDAFIAEIRRPRHLFGEALPE